MDSGMTWPSLTCQSWLWFCCLAFSPSLEGLNAQTVNSRSHKTTVTISGDEFHINSKPTYEGRTWRGHNIQGLLLNARMVQGIFDDRNPETASKWAYPDTGKWDAERNTREFIAAMPEW